MIHKPLLVNRPRILVNNNSSILKGWTVETLGGLDEDNLVADKHKSAWILELHSKHII